VTPEASLACCLQMTSRGGMGGPKQRLHHMIYSNRNFGGGYASEFCSCASGIPHLEIIGRPPGPLDALFTAQGNPGNSSQLGRFGEHFAREGYRALEVISRRYIEMTSKSGSRARKGSPARLYGVLQLDRKQCRNSNCLQLLWYPGGNVTSPTVRRQKRLFGKTLRKSQAT